MDFEGRSVFIGPRADTETASDVAWTAWSWTVDGDGGHEVALAPVHTYAEAEGLVRSMGAERLFVPADVLADMVRQGAGPA